MRKLIWKEWHEQSWKLGFGCIVLSALIVIGLHARIVSDATMVAWACGIAVTVLPVIAATGLVAAERADGSLESLLSLPIAAWKILLVKTVAGGVLCVGPVVAAAVFTFLMAGGRENPAGDFLDLYTRSAATSVALLVWMIALTIRLPNEARAALLSMGVLVIWLMVSAGLVYGPLASRAFAASPFSLIFHGFDALDGKVTLPLAVGAQCVILVFVWQFARRNFAGAVEGQS